jgi:hypothetical protein
VQSAWILILKVAAIWIERHERIFSSLEMRELPAPTELLLAVARFVNWPAGLGITTILIMVTAVSASRGLFDPILKKLIAFNVIAMGLFALLCHLSMRLPLAKIQEHLEK